MPQLVLKLIISFHKRADYILYVHVIDYLLLRNALRMTSNTGRQKLRTQPKITVS